MKTRLLGTGLAVGLAAVLLGYLGCEQRRTISGQGEGTPAGILLWKDITQPQWERIRDEVLKKAPITPGADSRSKLFRLRRYDPPNPPVDEQNGELADTLLLYSIEFLDQKAAQAGFKGHAIQIGMGAMDNFQTVGTPPPASTPGGTPTPPENKSSSRQGGGRMPQAHFRQNITESQAMVDEVNGILNPSPTPTPP